jgi:hypothetical protein
MGEDPAVSRPSSWLSCKQVLILATIVASAVSLYVLLRANYPPRLSIHVEDSGKAYPGYTLLAPTVDDIGDDVTHTSMIHLVGLNGEPVHSWRVLGSVQLAKLASDGSLFYTTRDRSFRHRAGLRKVDPFSNVLWYYKCRADHDFSILPSGNVLVHCIEDRPAPAIAPGKVRSPRLAEVSPQGVLLWEWRGDEHIDELAALAGIDFPKDISDSNHMIDGSYDWAHNNAASVMEENASGAADPRFRAGNILISYCNLNTIAVIDRASGQIVWAWGPGTLDGQHDPTMLKNGNIMLFDNGTHRGYSRVVEMNPISREIVWEYSDHDDTPSEFFSAFTSGVCPLPNGNMLVCQASDMAPTLSTRVLAAVSRRLFKKQTSFSRLFEITRAKDVVWELLVSHSGPLYLGVYQAPKYSEAYVASLLEVVNTDDVRRSRRLRSLPYMR